MQLSLFLEVSKLLKLQGVVYFEGRLKSRYYGTSLCARCIFLPVLNLVLQATVFFYFL